MQRTFISCLLSRSMLILSEADVRKCLPIELAIKANRKALGALRTNGDGGATVPSRIGLPYGPAAAGDWTLFKPAAYSPPTHASNAGNHDDTDKEEELMGMKLVSVRGGNPSLGLPTVPATVMLIDCRTGEVSALLGGTYLTAARTAAGSGVATDLLSPKDDATPIHLTVFGAGLQAEMHIEAIRSVRRIGSLSVVNRSAGRAESLIEKIRNKELGAEIASLDIYVVLLDDRDGVEDSVRKADVICTTTNTTTPLFDGSWVKPGCHLNGVGSYTSKMEEICSKFISTRCRVVVDTPEALDVGDLQCITKESKNYFGLLGDVMAENVQVRSNGNLKEYDCTVFKSVGTAIQDVITAHQVYKEAMEAGIGSHVEM